MVISAPSSLIERKHTIPAITAALKTGTSHLPTARVAVECLEAWRDFDLRNPQVSCSPGGGRGKARDWVCGLDSSKDMACVT
jgi:hypothetical protein